MRVIHWFRNDLRLRDNTGLSAACSKASALLPIFIVDPKLLELHRSPNRRAYLASCLEELDTELRSVGSALIVTSGEPATVLAKLATEAHADYLTFNRDYTPFTTRRDQQVTKAVEACGTRVESFKDRVIFESDEVLTKSGQPFRIFTPFRNAWLSKLTNAPRPANLRVKVPPPVDIDVLAAELPFDEAEAVAPPFPAGGARASRRLATFLGDPVTQYLDARDRPALQGTSQLSAALRFGTLSIRDCVYSAIDRSRDPKAASGAAKWCDELIWRDFYQGLLATHPRILKNAFRREYDAISWNDDPQSLKAWQHGQTGYPIVDAAMRQLVQTGWMHNRCRMIVASFLVKDLLIDWRHGERFFMHHLFDGDPAANNGGWQWAASTGTDAQPYFRVFNPVLQGKKFDPDGEYVRRFVPEIAEISNRHIHCPWQSPNPPAAYPAPIVDHSERRIAAIARFEAARSKG